MNQSQFLAITCSSLEAREKSRVLGAIGLSFASHWLKNWRESFKPITKRSNRNHVITFDSHLKTAPSIKKMRYINAIPLPLPLAFRYRSKRHQLGNELVIQSRPAHKLWKWKGRVCNVDLFPYHCLEVSPCNMQSRCITRREKSLW